MKKLIVMLVLIALVSACAPKPAPTDPGREIEAAPGAEFKIVIDSNPTTGYHWEIVGELDAQVVELVGREYKGTDPQPKPGSGGVDVWTFKAVGAGNATITLGSYPPGDATGDPAQSETFTIVVK